jgi:hypothetical protein
MAKSRNRSRDIRKRAQRKRMNRERLARKQAEILAESKLMLDVAEILRKAQNATQNNDNS